MTEEQKKEMYAKEYSRWLEWHKTYFSRYESYLKIPLKERWEILEHFKSIFEIMKRCGVCRFEGEEPMSNVTKLQQKAARRWKSTQLSGKRSMMLKRLRSGAKRKRSGKLGIKRKKSGELNARKIWMNGRPERMARRKSLKLGMTAYGLCLMRFGMERSIGMLMRI